MVTVQAGRYPLGSVWPSARTDPPARSPEVLVTQTRAPRTEADRTVANIKSQIKRNRQNAKATDRNKAVKSEFKTAIRKFREAADAGDKAQAETLMRDASKLVDKAAGKGVIHTNQAANKKARMASRLAKVA